VREKNKESNRERGSEETAGTESVYNEERDRESGYRERRRRGQAQRGCV